MCVSSIAIRRERLRVVGGSAAPATCTTATMAAAVTAVAAGSCGQAKAHGISKAEQNRAALFSSSTLPAAASTRRVLLRTVVRGMTAVELAATVGVQREEARDRLVVLVGEGNNAGNKGICCRCFYFVCS